VATSHTLPPPERRLLQEAADVAAAAEAGTSRSWGWRRLRNHLQVRHDKGGGGSGEINSRVSGTYALPSAFPMP
jgi:hypothetical protein